MFGGYADESCRRIGVHQRPNPISAQHLGSSATRLWPRSLIADNAVSVSRPPSTQAEPSRRGPWRPGRAYSGALHLDAMNHARSTVCGSTADGMGAGVSAGLLRAGRGKGVFVKPERVAVVGVGVLGASVGWNLSRRGVKVVFIDAGQPGEGVTNWSFSWANASNKTVRK
ncbi:FAD-dependent oxidoreductase, partial [Streptomyces sp. NPDC056728]